MNDTFETALLMIASTRAAIKNGVKHFDLAGNPLNSEMEIMRALERDRKIVFDTNSRVQVTTDEVELELLKAELAAKGH